MSNLTSIIAAIDSQIGALQTARKALLGDTTRTPRKAAAPVRRRRPKMTPAQKKAVSLRMKAYWAKKRKSS